MARRKQARKPKPSESTALVRLSSVQPPVLRRYREKRKFIAIRLREGTVTALDRYVAGLQESDDTTTRTEIVEQAIREFLKRRGALEA